MRIGFYTSTHYIDSKRQSVQEAAERLGIEPEIIFDEAFVPTTEQAYGFEELFKRTKVYARQALTRNDLDIGVGVENSLSFINSADEWFYTICIALETKDGRSTSSLTPAISIPLWMIKQIQDENIKIDVLTERLAKEDDPVSYFSEKTLTRKDIMLPAVILAFSNLALGNL